MICPYCHQEIPQGSDRCPHCGRSIVQKPIEEEPRLSRGMKVFIAVGGALLAAFTIYNAVSHFGDPEYTRTPSYLEPDSTLIEQLEKEEATDLVSVDTAAADSIEQLEKEEAKKVYNSIRRPQRNEEDKEAEASSEGEASSSDDAASTAPSSAPSPSVSAPKVEAIGNE